MPDKLTTIGKLDDSDDGLGDDDPDGDHEDDDNGDDASGGQLVVVPGALVVVGSRAIGPGRHQLNGLSCLKVKTFPTGFRRELNTVLVLGDKTPLYYDFKPPYDSTITLTMKKSRNPFCLLFGPSITDTQSAFHNYIT